MSIIYVQVTTLNRAIHYIVLLLSSNDIITHIQGELLLITVVVLNNDNSSTTLSLRLLKRIFIHVSRFVNRLFHLTLNDLRKVGEFNEAWVMKHHQ